MTNSRSKGIRGELEAAKLWLPYYPECRRSFGQSRIGYELPDLIGGIEKDWFVEVKRYKKITDGNIRSFWDKTVKDYILYLDVNKPIPAPTPLLMYRQDGGGWRVQKGMLLVERMTWKCFINAYMEKENK